MTETSPFSARSIWPKIALFNLFLASILGASMRYAFVSEIPGFDYQNVLHAHSHLAMLGWVFLALFYFIARKLDLMKSKFVTAVFWISQLCIIVMLIGFLTHGYAVLSITASTIHTICAYILSFYGLRALKKETNHPYSTRFLKWSIRFLLFSTLGLWVMPILMLSHQSHSSLYYSSVQFFLHFQFNGWFLFATLGLFFRILEERGISINGPRANQFIGSLILATPLTFALAVAWTNPHPIVFTINSIGVVVQLIALFAFFRLLLSFPAKAKEIFHGIPFWLIQLAFLCFSAKILMQSSVVVPYVAVIAYTVRNFVIGFIHLVLLGMITPFILAIGIRQKEFTTANSLAKTGLVLFLFGFITSEALLFLQGTMLWASWGFFPNYYPILFGLTVWMPIGLLLFFLGQLQRKKGALTM